MSFVFYAACGLKKPVRLAVLKKDFLEGFMNKPNELLNDGCTCHDCPHYTPDPSGKTLGECEKTGSLIEKETHLTKGKNGCLYFDM